MYDIRVACSVQNYNEEEVPDCMKIAAEKIVKSMMRLMMHNNII